MTRWRRAATIGLVAAALALAGCRDKGDAAQADNEPRHHIGFLSASASPAFLDALVEGLADLGYVDGETVDLEVRTPENESELPAIAEAFVADDVDLIVAGGTRAVEAAKAATSTIPIVMTNSGDPVDTGLVDDLARPGGNITGLTQSSPALSAKRLELLKEAFPSTDTVAVVMNPGHPTARLAAGELAAAAPDLGLELVVLELREGAGAAAIYDGVAGRGVNAAVVVRDPVTIAAAGELADAARRARLPAIYETRNYLDAGGLMLYGPDFADLYRRAARYADRILRGDDPATTPIGQPTEFELVINTTAAGDIGMEIAESVRVRADELVE